MILADENINAGLIERLRTKGIEVVSIWEDHRGVTDKEVIGLSKEPPRLILTEDKDFGEWVYAHNEKSISVIFLRYQYKDQEQIERILQDLLASRSSDLYGKFTIITKDKIRIRTIAK